MRVVHLSASDVVGGAARAAYRLHDGLVRRGCESTMLVLSRRGADPSVAEFVPPGGLAVRVRRKLRRTVIARQHARYAASRPPGYELFSDDRSPHGDAVAFQLPPADVVNLHWVAGFVDCGSLLPAVTGGGRAAVWTLHDMNAFTGGCHYDLGCGKYNAGCGACPQLGSACGSDLSRRIWTRKKEVFGRIPPDRLHIVAPSRWLAEEAGNSALLGRFPRTVIPYGLDVDAFAPRDRRVSREIFGIPAGARVILFVAESVTNRRKGFSLLDGALADWRGPANACLVSLGHDAPAVRAAMRHVHVGYLDKDRLVSSLYSAADVFVIPSLQDNLPNTVLEAMACGTPVVGFAAGGIPDMVRPGVTGLLAPPGDAAALRGAIAALLDGDEERARMSAACRSVAVGEYSVGVQAERYAALYAALAGQGRSAPAGRTGEAR